MTLDQIEEMQRGNDPGLSLQQASAKVGLGFRRCENCKGRGFTKATLLMSPQAIWALATACPKEQPAIQYERCNLCDGAGGHVIENTTKRK